MNNKNLIGYIGDYRIHDSKIHTIETDNDIIHVSLVSENKEIVKATFIEVKSIKSNDAEGMILYSIIEIKEQQPYRKFTFVNWDEDDASSLEIVAKDLIINFQN